MVLKHKGHIAFISVHGDPAAEIGKEAAGGQNVYVRQVGEALARKGWMVDIFTRRSHPLQSKFVEHSPRCRTVRLSTGSPTFIDRNDLHSYLPEFVESFMQFQHQSGIIYPLVHTHYWLSGAVGLALQKRQLIKQVHTYHSLGVVKYQNAKTIPMMARTRLQVETDCLEQADRVVAMSSQEQVYMRSLVSLKGKIEVIPWRAEDHLSWDEVATQLNRLYQQLQVELSQEFFRPVRTA